MMENAPEIRTLAIDKIQILDQVQARESLNDEVVDDYAEKTEAGVIFPRPVVFDTEEGLVLGDGHHRIAARSKLGIETVEAEVRQGSVWDAILFAAGANSQHGLPRTNADKRKAVTNILMVKEFQIWSDGQIAEACAVSATFVGKVRRETTPNDSESSTPRKCRDGRVINTAGIGKKRRAASGNAPAPPAPHGQEPPPVDLAAGQEEVTEPPAPFNRGEAEGLRSRNIELEGLLKARNARIEELEDEKERLEQEVNARIEELEDEKARLEQEVMDLREKLAMFPDSDSQMGNDVTAGSAMASASATTETVTSTP